MSADNVNENIGWDAFIVHGNPETIADKVAELYEKEETFVQSVWAIDRNFQFTGTSAVKSHADVAHIMRLLEGKIVEHSFAVHVNKDDKSHIQLLSIGGIAGTIVDPRLVLEGVNKFGSKKVYLVHNHPSGNLQPSQADLTLSKKIFDGLREMGVDAEHLIMDGLISSYTVIDNDINTRVEQRQIPAEDVGLEVQFLESNKFLKTPTVIIQDFSDTEGYIQSLQYLALPKRAMLVLNELNRIIGNYILNEFTAKEILEKFTKAGGGTSVILYGNEDALEKVNEVSQKLINFDIALFDFVRVSPSEDISRQYESAAKRGLLRDVQEQYGTNMLNEPMSKLITDIADLRAHGISDADIKDLYMEIGDNTEAEIDSVLNPVSNEELNAKQQTVEPTNKMVSDHEDPKLHRIADKNITELHTEMGNNKEERDNGINSQPSMQSLVFLNYFMNTKTKKILIGFTLIVLILAFLNPSRQDFAEYKGYRKDHNFNNISRKANFIIFSIYEEHGQNYFAILKNFF